MINSKNPKYKANISDWIKYRSTYNGGQDFINRYLVKFSDFEQAKDFANRILITYVPAFAKGAINDVKNAIFQRATDITRLTNSDTYNKAVNGNLGGVDLQHNTMNAFIGKRVLPDLLAIQKVGVFVDMPIIAGTTIAETSGVHPYLYTYKAEDILNWVVDSENRFTNLLLRDTIDKLDENGLPESTEYQYRHLVKLADGVLVEIYNKDDKIISSYKLDIPEIPFVLFELSDSLLKDIANYQIALMNLASSDMNYALRCNFPFYVEQYDPRAESSAFLRRQTVALGEDVSTEKATDDNRVNVGAMVGRRYPLDTEKPGFINPSPEPLKASMEKQKQLKEEIRQLIALAITNIDPQQASAESKSLDQQGLEAGLSYIGLELETGERNIFKFWSMYEGKDGEATIKYPQKYTLEPDSERRKEGQELLKMISKVPSQLYKRKLLIDVANLTLGTSVTDEELQTIKSEIEDAKIIDPDPEILSQDIEDGLINLDEVAKAKNYPEGSVEKAAKEHAEKLKRIAEAQTPVDVRGVKETQTNNVAKDDKEGKPQRGDGKNNNE